MLMAKLCNKCDVTKDTVRYYHKIGLLQLPRKGEQNGYGIYCEKHVERLLFIKKLKSFGFSLKEIKFAIALEERGEISNEVRIEVLKEKLNEVNIKLKELNNYKESLETALINLINS